MAQIHVDTRFGPLCITEDDGAICRVTWGHAEAPAETALLRRAADQLRAYDAGVLEQFDLPLAVRGNALVQAMASGHLANLRQGRAAIAASVHLETFNPGPATAWDEAFQRFQALDAD